MFHINEYSSKSNFKHQRLELKNILNISELLRNAQKIEDIIILEEVLKVNSYYVIR